MRYSLRTATFRKTKNRFISLTTAAVLAVTSMSGVLPLLLTEKATAATVYNNGFEANTNGWTAYSAGASINQESSPLTAASGSHYATIDGSMYTKWGGYSNVFPTYGYTTSIDVYLDADLATAGADRRFDFSSAINDTSNNHLKDFMFSVGTDPTTDGQWLANVGSNAPGNPSALGNTTLAGDQWYTLESNFHNDGLGKLGVRMTIENAATNAVVKYWDITTTESISTVGGNRYGWFTNQRFDFDSTTPLAIDTVRMATNPAPTKVYVDNSYLPGGTSNDDHIYGYDAFNTLEAGLSAVAAGGTVHVYDGPYANVQLHGTYADNITVKGHGNPVIQGIDLTGATFDGLTFDNFTFRGQSGGYAGYAFTINGDGNYANLSVMNSTFNGQNGAGRSAIFINRGFTGLELYNNDFKNYNNSSSVYSIVMVEAQGPDMGDGFTAMYNDLTNSNATNFLESYRWKNVYFAYNTVDATSGRIVVWSNDSDSLETVTIEGNNVVVTDGTGIGVFYAPNTTANIVNNTVDGADICLKVNSVSTSVIKDNFVTNCGVALALASTGSTAPVSTTVTGNSFAGPVENTSSQTVDVSDNNTCADANCTSYVPKPVTPAAPTQPAAPAPAATTPATVARTTAVTTTSNTASTGAGVQAAATVLGLAAGIAATNTNNDKAAVTTPKTTEDTSNNFLGLGWWWLAVLAVVALVVAYFAAARRSNNA